MKINKFIIIVLGVTFLTACSFSIHQKEGSYYLVQASQDIDRGHIEQAKEKYTHALLSSRRDIRAKAYSEIANIEKQGQDYQSYILNLENAADLYPEKYDLKLAQAYFKYGDTNQIETSKKIFMRYQEVSADANIRLAELAKNDSEIMAFVEKARSLLDVSTHGDIEGKNALKMARTYKIYGKFYPDFERADYWYRQSIAKGNTNAAYELAMLWKEKDMRENAKQDAFQLILKAAKNGQKKAIKDVAKAYANGIGTKQDVTKAIVWYEKWANDYDERGAYEFLSEAYLSIAEKNLKIFPEKSLNAYKNARRLGSQKGNLALAIWDNNKGLIAQTNEKDILKQARNLRKLLDSHQKSLNDDLESFLSARGLVKKQKSSNKATPHDDLLQSAQSLLANADDQKNVTKAFEIYRQAADKGNVEAQYQVGLMYARGLGVEKDMNKAKEWLEKARVNEYPLALETLKSLATETE